MGYFCNKICIQDPSKIAQTSHTGLFPGIFSQNRDHQKQYFSKHKLRSTLGCYLINNFKSYSIYSIQSIIMHSDWLKVVGYVACNTQSCCFISTRKIFFEISSWLELAWKIGFLSTGFEPEAAGMICTDKSSELWHY